MPRNWIQRLQFLVTIGLVLQWLIQIAAAIDLPPAPAGFVWQEVPELKAAFLKPSGWFFRQEVQQGTQAYFITKEDISKGGEFKTGLTLNVFHLRSDPAVERGKSMIENVATSKHGETWTQKFGPFIEFGCLVKDTDATGTTVMNVLAVANPKTNTLYFFIFESPAADWDKAWKTGKQMMDTLALDDEV